MQVGILKHAGRSILVNCDPDLDRPEPMLVELHTRESGSAPEGTRLKATLAVEFAPGHRVPLPFAQPIVGLPIACGYTPEFRLEMN